MKHIVLASIALLMLGSCSDSDTKNVWDTYTDWRNANDKWVLEQMNRQNDDGTMFYERVSPPWNPESYVLIHFFNNREETAGNLTPLFTSTVSVKYIGKLYNGTTFDTSFSQPDSVLTITSAGVISGWQIALANMHVGDTCEVIIPYEEAYYASSQGSILPFSCLQFNMRLVDIPYYEIKP